MIINHNMMAMNTYNKLASNNATASKSLEKLSPDCIKCGQKKAAPER